MRIRATTQKSPLLIGASLKCGMPAAPSFSPSLDFHGTELPSHHVDYPANESRAIIAHRY
jgi:hypothetical protein